MKIDIPEIVGLTINEAKKILDKGIILRALSDSCSTCDYRFNRLNVEVKNGVISNVLGWG